MVALTDEDLKLLKGTAKVAGENTPTTNTTTTKTTGTNLETGSQSIKDSLKGVEQKDVSGLKSIWQSTKGFLNDVGGVVSTLWNRYVSNKDKKKGINDYKQYNDYMGRMASTTSQEEYNRLYDEMVGKNIINEKQYKQYQEEEKNGEKYEFEQAKQADRDTFNQKFEEAMEPYMKNINNRYQIDCISSAVQKMEKQYELFHDKIMTAYEDTRDDRLLEKRDEMRKEYEDNIINFTTKRADNLVKEGKTYSTAYKDTIANNTYRDLANGITTMERQMTNKIYQYTIGKNLGDMVSYNPLKTMYNGLVALKNTITWGLSQVTDLVEEAKELGGVYDVTEKLNNLYVFDEAASTGEHIAESARWLWRSILDYAPQVTPAVIELIVFKKAGGAEKIASNIDKLADAAKIGKIGRGYERIRGRSLSTFISDMIADNLLYDEAFQAFVGRPITNEEENINLTFNLAIDGAQALIRAGAKWIKPALKDVQLKTDMISEAALTMIKNEDNEARAIEKYYILRGRELDESTNAFKQYQKGPKMSLEELKEVDPKTYEKVIKVQEGSTKYYERLSTYKGSLNDMLLEAEQTFKRKDLKKLSTLELVDRIVGDVRSKSKFLREAGENILLGTKTTGEVIYRGLERGIINEEYIRTLVKAHGGIDGMDDLVIGLAKSDNELINRGIYTIGKGGGELSTPQVVQLYNNILADLLKSHPDLVGIGEMAGTFMKGKDGLFRNIFEYDAKGFNLDEFVEHIKSEREGVFGSDRIALMDNLNSTLSYMERQMIDNPNAGLEQDVTNMFRNINGFSLNNISSKPVAEQEFIKDVIKKAGFKLVEDEKGLRVLGDITTLQKLKTNITNLGHKPMSSFNKDDVDALKFLYIGEFTSSFTKYTQNVGNPSEVTKSLQEKGLVQPKYNKKDFSKDYKCWFDKMFDIKEVKGEDGKTIKTYSLKLQFGTDEMQKQFRELIDNNAKFKDIERLAATNIIQDITQKALNLNPSDEQLLKDIKEALVEGHYAEGYTKEIDPIVNALFNQVKWLSSMGIKEDTATKLLGNWFGQIVVDKDTLQILSRVDSDYLYKGIISRLVLQDDSGLMMFENSIKNTLDRLPMNIKRENKGLSTILESVENLGQDIRLRGKVAADAENYTKRVAEIDKQIREINDLKKINSKSAVGTLDNTELNKKLTDLKNEKKKLNADYKKNIEPYMKDGQINISTPGVTITDKAIFLSQIQDGMGLVKEVEFTKQYTSLINKLRNKGRVQKEGIDIGGDRVLIKDISKVDDSDLKIISQLVAYKSMSELGSYMPGVADEIGEEIYRSLLDLRTKGFKKNISFGLGQGVEDIKDGINLSLVGESKVIQTMLGDDYMLAGLMNIKSADQWLDTLNLMNRTIELAGKERPIEYLELFTNLNEFAGKTDSLEEFIRTVNKNIKASNITDKEQILEELAGSYLKIHKARLDAGAKGMKTFEELVGDSGFIGNVTNSISNLRKIKKDLNGVINLYGEQLGKESKKEMKDIVKQLDEVITMYKRMKELAVGGVKTLEDIEGQLTAKIGKGNLDKAIGIQKDLPVSGWKEADEVGEENSLLSRAMFGDGKTKGISQTENYKSNVESEAMDFLNNFNQKQLVPLNDLLDVLGSKLGNDGAIKLYNGLKRILPANATISKDKLLVGNNVKKEYIIYKQAGGELSLDGFILNRNVATILSNFGMYNETTLKALNHYMDDGIIKGLYDKIITTNPKGVIQGTNDTTLLETTIRNLYYKGFINLDGYTNINQLVGGVAEYASKKYGTELGELNKALYRHLTVGGEQETEILASELSTIIKSLFGKRAKQDVANLLEGEEKEIDKLVSPFSSNWNNMVAIQDTVSQFTREAVNPMSLGKMAGPKGEYTPKTLIKDIVDTLEETGAIKKGTGGELYDSLDMLDLASDYQDLVDAFKMEKFTKEDLLNSKMFDNIFEKIKNKAEAQGIVSKEYKKTPSKWMYSKQYKNNSDSLGKLEEHVKTMDEGITPSIGKEDSYVETIGEDVGYQVEDITSQSAREGDVEQGISRANYETDYMENTSNVDKLSESRSQLNDTVLDFIDGNEMLDGLKEGTDLQFSPLFIIEEDDISMIGFNGVSYNAPIRIASVMDEGNKKELVEYAQNRINKLKGNKDATDQTKFLGNIISYSKGGDKVLTVAEYTDRNGLAKLVGKDIKGGTVNKVDINMTYRAKETDGSEVKNKLNTYSFDINSEDLNLYKTIDNILGLFENNGKVKIDISQGKNNKITSIYLNKDNFRTSALGQDLLERMGFSRNMGDFGSEYVFKEIQSKLYDDALLEETKGDKLKEVYLDTIKFEDGSYKGAFEERDKEVFEDCLTLSGVQYKYVNGLEKEAKENLLEKAKKNILSRKGDNLTESDKLTIAHMKGDEGDWQYIFDNHYLTLKDIDAEVKKLSYTDAAGKEVKYNNMNDYIMRNYYDDLGDRKTLGWSIVKDKKFKNEVYSRYNSNLVNTYKNLEKFNKPDGGAYDTLVERLHNYTVNVGEGENKRTYILTGYRQDFIETRDTYEATSDMLENDTLMGDMTRNVNEDYSIIPGDRRVVDADSRNEQMHMLEGSDEYMQLNYINDPDTIIVRMQNVDNQGEVIYGQLKIDHNVTTESNGKVTTTYSFYPFEGDAKFIDPIQTKEIRNVEEVNPVMEKPFGGVQKYDWDRRSFTNVVIQEKQVSDAAKVSKDGDDILEKSPFDFISSKFIENRYLNWTNNDIIKESPDLQQIIGMRSNFIRQQGENLKNAVTKFEDTLKGLSKQEQEEIYNKIKSAANRYIGQGLGRTPKVTVEGLTKEQQEALDGIMNVFSDGNWKGVYQLAAIQTKEGFQSTLKNIAHNHMGASLEYFGLGSKNAVKTKLTGLVKQFEQNEKQIANIVEDIVGDPLGAGKLYNFLTGVRSARRFIKYGPLFPLTGVLMFINSAVMGNIRYVGERRGFLDIMKTGAFDRLITKAGDTIQIGKETKKGLGLADSMNRADEIMFNSNSDLGGSWFDKALDWMLGKLPVKGKTRELVETMVKGGTHSAYDFFAQGSVKSMALAKALVKNGVTAKNIDDFANLLEAGKIGEKQLNQILADTEMIYSRFFTNSATSLLSRHKFSRWYMVNALQGYVINRSDEVFSSIKNAVNWISSRRQLAKQKIGIAEFDKTRRLSDVTGFKRSDFTEYLETENQELQSLLMNVLLSAKFGFYFDKAANGGELNSETYSRYLIDTSDYLSSLGATFFWNIFSAPFEGMIDYAEYTNANYDDFNIGDGLTVAGVKLISQVCSQFFREGKFLNALSSGAVALGQTGDLDFSYDVLVDEFRKIASGLGRFQLVEGTNTYGLDNMGEQGDFIGQILFNNQYTSTAGRIADKLQSLQTVDKILNGENGEYVKQTLLPYLPVIGPMLSNITGGSGYSFSATKYKELLHIMDKDNVVNWLNDYDIENDHGIFANSDWFGDEQIKRLYQELTAFDYPEKQYIGNDLFDTGYEGTLEPIKEDIFTEELLRSLDWDKEKLDEWLMSGETNKQKGLLKVMAAADASRPGSSKIVLSYLANRYNYNRMKELTGNKYGTYKDLPVEIQNQLNRETVELYYPYMFVADKTSWYKAITEYVGQHYPLFEDLYKDDDLTGYTSTLGYMDMIMYQQAKEGNVNAKFIKNSWSMLSKYFKNEPARINAITYTMNSIDNAGFSKGQATAAKMGTLAANMDIYDKYQKNAMALSLFGDDIENYNYFVWGVLQDINDIGYEVAKDELGGTSYGKYPYTPYKRNNYSPYSNYSNSGLGNNNIPEAEKFVPAATKYLNGWQPTDKAYTPKRQRTYQPGKTLDYYRKVYEARVKALSDKLVGEGKKPKQGSSGSKTYDWQYKYGEGFRNRGYVNPARLVFPRHKQPAYSTKVLANMPGASG